jgi:hypothetical protein
MNQNEALEEAVRRWGRDAHVRYYQGQIPKGTLPYAVGRWEGRTFRMYGQGHTWEEAFQEADKKGSKEHDPAANDKATAHAGIRPKEGKRPESPSETGRPAQL